MKKATVLGLLFVMVSYLGLNSALAQKQTAPAASLGDLAQKLKADRARAAQKPAKVFTNDNLPARPAEENPSVAAGMSKTPQTPSGEKSSSNPSSTAASSGVHDEKYFHTRMLELQAQRDMHARQLDVLHQKLSQNQMQYYPDPTKTLLQTSSPSFHSDVNKLQAEIEKKKQQIAGDEKAMDDLRDQVRREGGNPGWLRIAPGEAAQSATSPAEETGGQESVEATAGGEKEESGDKLKTKEYWQARFKSARAELEKAQDEQQLVEDELNLLGIQQARELNPKVKDEISNKIAAKKPAAEAKRAATAKAQKALDDLQKKFKDSGAPDEWSQTE